MSSSTRRPKSRISVIRERINYFLNAANEDENCGDSVSNQLNSNCNPPPLTIDLSPPPSPSPTPLNPETTAALAHVPVLSTLSTATDGVAYTQLVMNHDGVIFNMPPLSLPLPPQEFNLEEADASDAANCSMKSIKSELFDEEEEGIGVHLEIIPGSEYGDPSSTAEQEQEPYDSDYEEFDQMLGNMMNTANHDQDQGGCGAGQQEQLKSVEMNEADDPVPGGDININETGQGQMESESGLQVEPVIPIRDDPEVGETGNGADEQIEWEAVVKLVPINLEINDDGLGNVAEGLGLLVISENDMDQNLLCAIIKDQAALIDLVNKELMISEAKRMAIEEELKQIKAAQELNQRGTIRGRPRGKANAQVKPRVQARKTPARSKREVHLSDIQGENVDMTARRVTRSGRVLRDKAPQDAGEAETLASGSEGGVVEVVTPNEGEAEVVTPNEGAAEVVTPNEGEAEVVTPNEGEAESLASGSEGGVVEVITPNEGEAEVITPNEDEAESSASGSVGGVVEVVTPNEDEAESSASGSVGGVVEVVTPNEDEAESLAIGNEAGVVVVETVTQNGAEAQNVVTASGSAVQGKVSRGRGSKRKMTVRVGERKNPRRACKMEM